MVQKLEAGVPSGVTQPVVFKLLMYSPTGFVRVIDAPCRASAFTRPPIVGSLARPGVPYPAQQINASWSGNNCPWRARRMVACAAILISASNVFAGCVRCTAPLVVFHLL